MDLYVKWSPGERLKEYRKYNLGAFFLLQQYRPNIISSAAGLGTGVEAKVRAGPEYSNEKKNKIWNIFYSRHWTNPRCKDFKDFNIH